MKSLYLNGQTHCLEQILTEQNQYVGLLGSVPVYLNKLSGQTSAVTYDDARLGGPSWEIRQ